MSNPAPLSYEEVSKFHERQRQVKASNEAYIAAFPELNLMLSDFVNAVLQARPSNIKEFASSFFDRYTPSEDDKGLVPTNTGIGEVTVKIVGSEAGAGGGVEEQ